MKVKKLFKVMFIVLILLFMVGSSLARELPADESITEFSVSSNPSANARWLHSEIDTPGNTGQHTSIAIDPATNTTYISYYDYTNKQLRLAMDSGFGTAGNCGPGNSWLCQTVDDTYGVGQYSSIDINPTTGEIGIAYYDETNGQLKYAHAKICPTCIWAKDIIDKPILFPTDSKGRYTSLKFHSDGTAYIAYYFQHTSNVDALMVATSVGSSGNCGFGSTAGQWQCDTIYDGEGMGQYASLALDGAGNRHIAFYDASNGDLWYARSGSTANCGPGNSWLCIPVDSASDVGQYASIYVDSGHHFHIAYYDATADRLKYAVDLGSGGNCGVFNSAQCDTIDSMGAGTHPQGVSIAEDSAGYPVIAYQDEFGALNVARPLAGLGLAPGSGNCGPETPFSTWRCDTVKTYMSRVNARQADFVSIAIHESGLGTIAYNGFIQAADSNLAFAYQRFHVFEPLVLNNH